MQHKESLLSERLHLMQSRIATACQRVGRATTDVRMIAVTKYSSLSATINIHQLGVNDLGESRWQEAKAKWEVLGDQATWHFIGHLQTNKVKDVIDKFTFIHSLDRLSLAQELQRKAEQLDIVVNCLVQLNISGEQTKFGLASAEVERFFELLRQFPRIHVKGLMTMAPYEASDHEARSIFRELREWRDRINQARWTEEPLQHLSMGMSDDFEIAIEEGATMIRLGSALMGEA